MGHRRTAVLALNHSATFDMIDHDILLQVLKNQYGIDGKALKWCDSLPTSKILYGAS